MDLGLSGFKALVTGGSAGIGLGIAKSLLEEGANVAIVGRDPTRLESAVQQLAGARGRAFGIPGDVTVPDQARSAVERAATEFGGLDLVAACVGGHVGDPWLVNTTSADWTATLELNVVHSVTTVRAALPHLRDTGRGSVLFVSSITGWRPGPASSYAAAKAALIHLAATLAQELGPYGVRVNALSPGSTADTDGWIEYARDEPEAFARFLEEDLPLRRLVTTQQVAEVAALVLSPRGAGINGANIPVDAGQYRPHAIRFPKKV
jgi:3-oxoacyl-[acyl-carrier protein] reductase